MPDEIGEMLNLEELSFSDNKLIRIPASIGNLSTLKTLIMYSLFLFKYIGQIIV